MHNISHCLINGEILPVKDKHLSVWERGFILADGVFETILIRNGKIVWWQEHLKRLKEAMSILRLSIHHEASMDNLLPAIEKLYQKNQCKLDKDYALRLTIGRGEVKERNLWREDWQKNTALTIVATINEHQAREAVTAGVAGRIIKYIPHPMMAVKWLAGYGDHILARQEMAGKGKDEAIILNQHGHVIGASIGNIFLYHNGMWQTPPLTDGCIKGIARQKIIANGVEEMVEKNIAKSEIVHMTAGFVSNSLGLTPIKSLDGNEFDEKITIEAIEKYKTIYQP